MPAPAMRLLRLLRPAPAIVLLATGCGRHEPPANEPELPAVRVQAVPAELREMATFVEVTGSIRPVQRATIAARVMGTIVELPVGLGQAVETGALLARVHAPEIAARVQQAQAQLSQAQHDLTREQRLLAKDASTSDLVKSLEDRVAMADAMVREAEAMLGHATITAPFKGVIARKWVNVGDLAAPGAPLLELEGTEQFEVEAGIPDSLAAGLRPGATLAVVVPAAQSTFAARLTELSSAADPRARTITAKLAVPPDVHVHSGQFARVRVPASASPALYVPADAVTVSGQLERVFVAEQGRAILRLVRTGTQQDGRIEILAGLNDGELVITNPPPTLREGQPVEVAP